MAPALSSVGQEQSLGDSKTKLAELLESADLPEQLDDIRRLAKAINDTYQDFYRSLHQERFELYSDAIDTIKGRKEILQLDDTGQQTVLQLLEKRRVAECDLVAFCLTPRNTGTTLRELQSDIEAQPGLQAAAIARIQDILAKVTDDDIRLERVRLAHFSASPGMIRKERKGIHQGGTQEARRTSL